MLTRNRDYVDMIEENWLSDVIFTTAEIKADLTKVGTGVNGDFQAAALSRAINTDETNELVVKTWMAKAKDRHSTLIFCVDLSHVTNLTALFRQSGYHVVQRQPLRRSDHCEPDAGAESDHAGGGQFCQRGQTGGGSQW